MKLTIAAVFLTIAAPVFAQSRAANWIVPPTVPCSSLASLTPPAGAILYVTNATATNPVICSGSTATTARYESGQWNGGGGAIAPAGTTIGATFINGGFALSGTTTICQAIPLTGVITAVRVTADISGSATIGITTVASGSYTGIAGYGGYTSIVASDPPSLSSQVLRDDTTLTGWTTTLTAGQRICFQVSSPSTITTLAITLAY